MLSLAHHSHPALPTQRGLHPALSSLYGLPIQALKAFGPRRAAALCDEVATGFMRACDTSGTLGMAGDLGISTDDIEAAADWLSRAARKLERACQ